MVYCEVSILYFQKEWSELLIVVLMVGVGAEVDLEEEVLVGAGVDLVEVDLVEVVPVDVGKIERIKVKTLPPIKSVLWF